MKLSPEEKLVLLIEEASEVIKAATKALRFGLDHNEPGYGVNSEKLAEEIGDLCGVTDGLFMTDVLSYSADVSTARRTKMDRAEKAKAQRLAGGGFACGECCDGTALPLRARRISTGSPPRYMCEVCGTGSIL
jgi:NTP pyrophosphatase (non-canonical NTP hydrolase)